MGHDEGVFLTSFVRLPYLDGIRGFCALYVAACHASASFLQRNPTGFVYPLIHVLGYGHLAVTIFIAISGFTLGLQVKPDRPFLVLPFLKRRFWRIVPPVYALTLLAIALAALRFQVLGIDWLPDQRQMLFNLLLLNDVFVDETLETGPLWTVALELRIYLLFPVLVWLHRRFGSQAVLLFAIAVSGLACWLNWYFNGWLLGLWFFCIFALSFLASQKALPEPKAFAWFAATLLLCLFWAFPIMGDRNELSGLLFFGDHLNRYWEFDLVTGLLLACLFQLSVDRTQPTWLEGFFGSRWLIWLGSFSYSLYLVHYPVFACWKAIAMTIGYRNPLMLFALAMVFAVVVGWLFYWTVERHFVRYKGRPAPPL
jgi:peptidoglycan/LPS O-acetylase OafA/YrhL